MTNSTLPLVTYEQAQRLKKAGFDWPTAHFYLDDQDGPKTAFAVGSVNPFAYGTNPKDWNSFVIGDETGNTSAPTVALALKWMRDVKGFAMAVGDCHMAGNVFEVEYMFSITPHNGRRMNFDIPTHRTYEAAESALLDELLKLIER